jgi:hypothetical protein
MWEELIKALDGNAATIANEEAMVLFSHAVAQLAVIINTLAVTDTVLNTLLEHDFNNVFEYEAAGVLKPSVLTLQGFSRLKDTQKLLSESQYQAYLSYFETGSITADNVIELLKGEHPESAVTAACTTIDSTEEANYVVCLDTIILLLEFAAKHNLSSAALDCFATENKTFTQWQALASQFESSLSDKQRIGCN